MECTTGRKKENKKRLKLQDCMAAMHTYGHIRIRQIKEKLRAAREAIAIGGVKTTQKYFVSLPTEQAHEGHPVGEAASFCQRIHPIILNKISDSGIHETN